jgi:uncharacterized protein (TIGR03435 family)
MKRHHWPLVTIGVPILVGSWYASGALAQSGGVSADTFDVASIKPATDKTLDRFGVLPGGRIELGKQTLRGLIVFAYDLSCKLDDCDKYVLGGPAWAYSLKFEVVAKPDPPDPPMDKPARVELARPRMRALLADRFQLRVSVENKEMPVYTLRVAKGGPKLKEETDLSGDKPRGLISFPFHTSGSAPIKTLIPTLALTAGRPVLDRTGLTGVYQIDLLWDPGDNFPRETFRALRIPDPPSIFTAVREQLGLTLEPERGPVKTIVIEHVEMLRAN